MPTSHLYQNFRFRLKWKGRYVAGFSKCDALMKLTVPRLSPDSPGRKVRGRTKYESITLERGVTHDADFENWAGESRTKYDAITLERGVTSDPEFQNWAGESLRRKAEHADFVLEPVNEAGKVTVSFKFCGCSVVNFQCLPDLDAAANTSDIELLELRYSTHRLC